MNNKNQIEMHELHIDEAKRMVNLADALERLQSNADFKLVINENYLQKEAARLVMLKASPAQMDPIDQEVIANRIIGVGQFNEYLRMVFALAATAEKAIYDHHESINELLAEEEV